MSAKQKFKTIINYHHPWLDPCQSEWEESKEEVEKEKEPKSNDLEFFYTEYVSDFKCLYSCEDDYVEVTKIVKRIIDDYDHEEVIFEDKKWKEGYVFDNNGDFQYDIYFDVLTIAVNKKRKFAADTAKKIPEKRHKSLVKSLAEKLEDACYTLTSEYKSIQESAKAAITSGEVANISEWNEKHKQTCNTFEAFSDCIAELQSMFDNEVWRASRPKELDNWMFKMNPVTKNSYILFPVVPKNKILVDKKKVSWNWMRFSGEKPTTWPLFASNNNTSESESEEEEEERPIYYSPKYEGWIVSLRHKAKLVELGAEEYTD